MKTVLDIKKLSIDIHTGLGSVKAVRNVDLDLKVGEILSIVGESGCGKTILCRSIQGILPKTAQIMNGNIDIKTSSKEKNKFKDISMIFQNPMTALNPTMKIGEQIAEGIRYKEKISKKEAKKEAIRYLELVGIDHPTQRYNSMPHEFSGGMRQRIVIAIALATKPQILIADEPTTSLDVTIQKQILNLILKLKDELLFSVIFVTHDLSIVASISDRVAVMYAGKIVEIGTTEDIFFDCRHPYTKALLESLPSEGGDVELVSIDGAPPSLINLEVGDSFARRNENALKIDYLKEPPMFKISETHSAATWKLHEFYKKQSDEVVEAINNG